MNWMQYILEFSHHLKHVREIGHGQQEKKKKRGDHSAVERNACPEEHIPSTRIVTLIWENEKPQKREKKPTTTSTCTIRQI